MVGFTFKYKALTFALYNLLISKFRVFGAPNNAGWFTSNTGSGAVSFGPFNVRATTGLTASSRALAYTYTPCWNSGNIGADYVDLSKALQISVVLVRDGNEPQAVARLQLKSVNAEGALAALGFGVEINNYDMVGEAYGTSRGTVSLGVTMGNDRVTRVRIVLVPNTRVEFWVNAQLKGTLTGAYVPTGSFVGNMVISIINGATPTQNGIYGWNAIEVLQWY